MSARELRADLQLALGAGFDVRDRVAQGRHATVFRVGDRQLQRWVAIKVLTADPWEGDRARARFDRGARLQAQLEHPHILRVHYTFSAGWLSYLVVPFVRESLAAALLREGRFPPREAARILLETAQALERVHAAGLVHRHLKPQHLLLDGDTRRVRLTDFTVACGTTTSGLPGPARGVAVGTPAYMSPEQAEGSFELDGRSDIYSLGVVGYQLLTGFVPFEGTAAEQLVAHRTRTSRNPAARHTDIPVDLAEVVLRCLAKLPQNRWASAAELVTALRAVAAGARWRGPHVRSVGPPFTGF
jgi:serine/threonine protein kinase